MRETTPNELLIENKAIQVKLSTKGIISGIIRAAVDIAKGSLGGGTIPEWIKALGIKVPEERQAFELVVNAILNACRDQLQTRIEQIDRDENENLVSDYRELKFELFEKLNGTEFTFKTKDIANPSQFDFLSRFKQFYKQWLLDSFPVSGEHAELMTADFPDYFATAFFNYLHKNQNKLSALITWCNNPVIADWQLQFDRKKYKNEILSYYQQPALGEKNISLSDVYIEPSFLVYDSILPHEKQKELRNEFNIDNKEHFLPTKYKGSLHRYLLNHFLVEKKSGAINNDAEKSRCMILLGQPGHGKSSFCYRAIHDMVRQSEISTSCFLIRMQNVDRKIIHNPLEGIHDYLPHQIDFKTWIQGNPNHKNLLFLDGLDEMFMTQCLTDELVRTFIDNCKRWIEQRTNLLIIITSRFNYIETSKLFNSDCLVMSLGTLQVTQQKELVQKCKNRTGIEYSLNESMIDECNSKKELQHIKELLELPILLQMILISGLDVKDAQSKASIYNNLFETVLNRKWDKDEKLKKYKKDTFKPEHLKDYIALLAFKIYESKQGYLHKSQIESFPETTIFKQKRLYLSDDGGDIKHVLKDILTSFYLKETKKDKFDNKKQDIENDYAIEFLHKSLYEYLSCYYIWGELKRFFLKKDEDEYQYYTIYQVLVKVQYLFGNVRLSAELLEHLQEIIDNDTACHTDLMKQMGQHMPKLLQYGFLYTYETPQYNELPLYTAAQQAINCFYGYWAVLGQLNQHKMNPDEYFNSSWNDFSKDNLNDKTIAELIEAYKIYIENLQEDNSLSIQNIDNELSCFKEWITNGKTNTNTLFYENWVRRQLYTSHGLTVFSPRILQKDKDNALFTGFLRLAHSERYAWGINCSFLNFEAADLHLISLTGMKLNGNNFRGANLSHARLDYTGLRDANFNKARLMRADLREVDLRRSNLHGANLQGALLEEALLVGAILLEANLEEAYLRGAHLERTVLERADLERANLQGAFLGEAALQGAILLEANLREAKLRGANLKGANLEEANLEEADLQRAILERANLRKAVLEGADLAGANLGGALLIEANLGGTDLEGAILEGAILEGANLRGADLRGADLEGADLCRAMLEGTDFNNTKLEGAKIFNKSIKGMEIFRTIKIKGIDWIEANYVISDELIKFMDEYGTEYEAYEIRKKQNTLKE